MEQLFPVSQGGRGAGDVAEKDDNQLYIFRAGPPTASSMRYFRCLSSLDDAGNHGGEPRPEQAARVMAMQSANDNAQKLLFEELQLEYNKLRQQQSITTELLSILSAARWSGNHIRIAAGFGRRNAFSTDNNFRTTNNRDLMANIAEYFKSVGSGIKESRLGNGCHGKGSSSLPRSPSSILRTGYSSDRQTASGAELTLIYDEQDATSASAAVYAR